MCFIQQNISTDAVAFSRSKNVLENNTLKTERGEVVSSVKQVEEPDISVAEVDGIFTFKVSSSKLKGELRPYYVTNLTTNKDVFDTTGARLVINAGFFDPRNHQTTSYLVQDEKLILDPHNNSNLMNNKHLQPYMEKILNRSELRVLKSKINDKIKYDIALHNDPIPSDYTLVHSIQGGPGLVPDLRLEEEFFVLTRPDGTIEQRSSSLSKYARTLVGIKNNDVYFVIATNQHPISLPEASDIMKAAEFEKAMAFDGGGSVSVDYKDENIHIVSERNNEARRLKSFWIIMPAKDDVKNETSQYFLQNSTTMTIDKFNKK
jgi:hypothetical protein